MTRPIPFAFALALPFVLPLAGCGGPTAAPANQATTAAATPADDAMLNRIEALDDKARNAVLMRAIRDAGQDCQEVTAAQRHDPVAGNPSWIVKCRLTGPWLLVLQPGGTMAVSAAAVAR